MYGPERSISGEARVPDSLPYRRTKEAGASERDASATVITVACDSATAVKRGTAK